jgi:hypothetical protein
LTRSEAHGNGIRSIPFTLAISSTDERIGILAKSVDASS